MKRMSVYTEEEFEKYKGICLGLSRITHRKLMRTHKGFCFGCERKKAEYPKLKPQLCVECFISFIMDQLREILKFGSENMDVILSEEQKARNKRKAKKTLEQIKKEPEKFAEKYEQNILIIIEREAKSLRFFEDN